MKLNWKQIGRSLGLVAVCGSLFYACTQYETPASIAGQGGTQEEDSTMKEIARKVLWVNIDGARGSVVKQAVESGQMPNLKKMLEHSKYTFQGLADTHEYVSSGRSLTGEDPVTWASMLTGMNSGIHRIYDTSYTPDLYVGEDPESDEVDFTSNIVQQITNSGKEVKMSMVSPWKYLNNWVSNINSVETTQGDDETKSVLLEQLANKDFSLTIASLRGVQDAGCQGGFISGNQNYMAALKKADETLGELLNSVEKRPQASFEDWLVCVTSDHGGTAQGTYGGASDAERDIFGVFYYNHYKKKEMNGKMMEVVQFPQSQDVEYASFKDKEGRYAISYSAAFSIEANIRTLPNEAGGYDANWRSMIGKTTAGKGWGVRYERTTAKVSVNSTNAGMLKENIGTIGNAKWHPIFAGVQKMTSNQVRKFQTSFDGNRMVYKDIEHDGYGSLDSLDFKVGGDNLGIPWQVSSIRIWNTFLDDNTVKNNMSLETIPFSHKYYKNLLGEWRFSREYMRNDTVLKNLVKGAPDLVFRNNHKPRFVKVANTLPPYVQSGNLIMENTLPLPNILYWLLGSSASTSSLDGSMFLQLYNTEEQWREMEKLEAKSR